ncbi:MAG: sigma-70 family RNA polymerase sigma factor [Turicibacter sp.]|nr:sigma-70 family RNA polymerase sigma factor [Turicibacter sp.]
MFGCYEMMEDHGVVALAQSGDKAALEFMVDKFTPLIWKHARQFKSAGHDMDDLVQEGFLSLVRAIKGYEHRVGGIFYSYAHQVIRNRFLHLKRSHQRRKGGDIPVEMGDFFNQAKFAYVEVMDWEKDKRPDIIREAFAREEFFTELEQSCLKLYLDGHNYTEMAKKLGTSNKAVDNALARCRQKLKRMCKKCGYLFESDSQD